MFDEDARDALIRYLGYVQTPLPSSQDDATQETIVQEEVKPVEETVEAPVITAEDLFSSSPVSGTSPVVPTSSPEEESVKKSEEVATVEETPVEWERAVKDRVIVGDFAGAVEVCFEYKRYADALVISTWGGAELSERTTVHVSYDNHP